MSASVVEVKNDDTFAYYTGYIKDFQGGQLLIHYDNGWKPDEWVVPGKVRQAVARHDPNTFHPQVGDEVEAMAKSQEDEPFSWWRAKVKTIRGEFFLINYSDWDESFNEIMEKDFLRPPNKNPCLDARSLIKEEVDIPSQLHETESEQQDQKLQALKQNKYAEIQMTSNLLSLIEDPARHKLLLLGTKTSVENAKIFASLHFTHLAQLKQLKKKTAQEETILQEQRRKLNEGLIEEFQVNPKLGGLVIGKKGKNIRDAEKIPGVLSVKVDADTGNVKIVAQNREAALEARKLLEYVEREFPVPTKKLGRIVGAKFKHLIDIEKKCQVMRISVPRRDDADANASQQNGNRRSKYRQDRYDEDEVTKLTILGTKDNVTTAEHMLKNHVEFVDEYEQEQSKLEDVKRERRDLVNTYGYKINRTESSEDVTADATETKKQRPRRRQPSNDSNSQDTTAENKEEASTGAGKGKKNARLTRNKKNEANGTEHTNGTDSSPAAEASPAATADSNGAASDSQAPAVDGAKPPRKNKRSNRKREDNNGQEAATEATQE